MFFFLWSWCNLDNVGGLWNFDNVGRLRYCWMNFGLNFRGSGIVKIFVVGLDEYIHGKSLLAYLNFVLWILQNFTDNYVGMKKFWTWEKFCWIRDVDVWLWFSYVRIYLCMSLWEFFYGYLGHVGTFCVCLWKNLAVVYRHLKKFWLW